MYSDLFIEQNRMYAFTCYVRDWKKQDPGTIERSGDIFSYRTKRGLVKRFQAVRNSSDATVRVQGFFFKALSDTAPTNQK